MLENPMVTGVGFTEFERWENGEPELERCPECGEECQEITTCVSCEEAGCDVCLTWSETYNGYICEDCKDGMRG